MNGLWPVWTTFIHPAEKLLYLTMFIMLISGYVFVMAGGYDDPL